MNRIAVTGAAGFIGSNLCRYFLDKGWEVSAIVNNLQDIQLHWRYIDHENITYDECDFNDPLDMFEAFNSSDAGVVINCMAYGGYSNQNDKETIYNVNQHAVNNMLECIVKEQFKIKAFIQLGTSSEYGLNSAGPDETSHTVPNSHYAISKLAATSLCQYYGNVHNVPTCVLRLGSVYGPFEDPGRLVMRGILTAIKGDPMEFNDLKITRDFVYIDDVCAAVSQALSKMNDPVTGVIPGDVFNISEGDAYTLGDFAYALDCEFDDFKFVENSFPLKAWDHKCQWNMDTNKAGEILEWFPQTSFRDGIVKTIEWVKANPEIIKNMRSVYE